jgi:hypothetical protein
MNAYQRRLKRRAKARFFARMDALFDRYMREVVAPMAQRALDCPPLFKTLSEPEHIAFLHPVQLSR